MTSGCAPCCSLAINCTTSRKFNRFIRKTGVCRQDNAKPLKCQDDSEKQHSAAAEELLYLPGILPRPAYFIQHFDHLAGCEGSQKLAVGKRPRSGPPRIRGKGHNRQIGSHSCTVLQTSRARPVDIRFSAVYLSPHYRSQRE